MMEENAESRGWSAITFGTTILLGAFLLFQVQPLVSKAILPWFGGCPSVWTTCMLFFQAVLFLGYVYAHLLQRWLSPRNQVILHVAVVAAALAVLPILPGTAWKPVDAQEPVRRILLLLGATVGLPYFALSATSPLVQAWFSHVHPGRSPYRLYALSNAGSLLALLSYPFVFEPVFDLSRQATLWSGAFGLYGALCGVCLICLWHLRHRTPVVVPTRPSPPPSLETASHPRRSVTAAAAVQMMAPGRTKPQRAAKPAWNPTANDDATPPTWLDWFRWLALPACASLMLLATTNHVCQDVAVVPFLWVMPLTLYLLSFILCFDAPWWYSRRYWAVAAVITLTATAVNDYAQLSSTPLTLIQELTVYFMALLCACMVCHGELAWLKPHPRYLTEFYLMISAGGVLGGLFVAVVAPLIFSNYLEWQIGVAASMLLAIGLLILPPAWPRTLFIRRMIFGAAVAMALIYVGAWGINKGAAVERTRNFFGVVAVEEHFKGNAATHELLLKNGRITHGRQFVDPMKRDWATSYYGEKSGVGQAIVYLQESGNIRVGAVGLGIGTLATYANPGDTFRFYEINPEVVRMARRRFTYLNDSRGACEIVLGDARLSLESEPPQNYSLLALDAFSGDAIPTHLLTREAFDVYLRHLAPKGVIAVHVSNNYLRLAPVIYRLAEHCGMKATRICGKEDRTRLLASSEWVLVTRDEEFVKAHPSDPPKLAYDDWKVPLWTDHFSNLFQILSRW